MKPRAEGQLCCQLMHRRNRRRAGYIINKTQVTGEAPCPRTNPLRKQVQENTWNMNDHVHFCFIFLRGDVWLKGRRVLVAQQFL